jgi:hypothetical protein
MLLWCRRGLILNAPLKLGVTPRARAKYNGLQDMFTDAAQRSQFASARVLAALPGVPSALSREFAFPSSSQSLR